MYGSVVEKLKSTEQSCCTI